MIPANCLGGVMLVGSGVHGNHSDYVRSSMRNQCTSHIIFSARVVAFIYSCSDMEFSGRSQSVCCTFTALWIAKINASHPNSTTCYHMSAHQDCARKVVIPGVILANEARIGFRVLLFECCQHLLHDGYECRASLAT